MRNQNLLKQYGITADDYDRMATEQSGLCAICGSGPVRGFKHLDVDHCHTTGRVRGLLCNDCNQGLGRFKDNPLLIQRALAYLSR